MAVDYEYKQHRKVTSLDLTKAPKTATHVATLDSGVMYFVRKEGHTWQIQPSNQYGKGYGGASLLAEGARFKEL